MEVATENMTSGNNVFKVYACTHLSKCTVAMQQELVGETVTILGPETQLVE